jgi:hypothetical protein
VVHARLDARIALRQPAGEHSARFRRASQIWLVALACAACISLISGRGWIALALLVAMLGYYIDLRRQRDSAALQLPLKKVGQRALAVSSVFAVLLIIGLW